MAEPLAPAASHDHDHKPYGWRRWVYATNHKDIGTMYLVFACTMFFIGGFMAMLIRLELFKPGLQFLDPQFFNSMTTLHALIMIFGAVMPAWTGLANWMIPMQIGAPDMALPRLNNFSFWILPFAFTLLLSSLFVPGGAPAGGWTMRSEEHTSELQSPCNLVCRLLLEKKNNQPQPLPHTRHPRQHSRATALRHPRHGLHA